MATVPSSTPQIQPTPTPVAVNPTNTPIPTAGPAVGDVLQRVLSYEFEKSTLDGNGWAEILGGFDANPAGTIATSGDISSVIASSSDGKGLVFKVQPKQVAFAYAKQPIQTGGKPVLIRMTVRASSPSASLALAALRGSFVNTALLDGSIGMNFPKSTKNDGGQSLSDGDALRTGSGRRNYSGYPGRGYRSHWHSQRLCG